MEGGLENKAGKMREREREGEIRREGERVCVKAPFLIKRI